MIRDKRTFRHVILKNVTYQRWQRIPVRRKQIVWGLEPEIIYLMELVNLFPKIYITV